MNNAAAWRCGGIDTPLGRSGLQHARSLARSGPSFQQAERTAVQTTTLAQLARAAALRTRVVDAGLSKYNLRGQAPTDWPVDRDILLVVGQVENDKSILLGCAPDLNTNSALVEAAQG